MASPRCWAGGDEIAELVWLWAAPPRLYRADAREFAARCRDEADAERSADSAVINGRSASESCGG